VNLHVWHAVHNAQLNAVISSNVTLFYICILLQFAQHTAANRVNLNLTFHWVTHADNKSWSMCDPCSMSDQLSERSTDCGLQKLSKESAAAFVDLLRQADPPITSQTSFAAIEAQCQADDRWQALSDDKR